MNSGSFIRPNLSKAVTSAIALLGGLGIGWAATHYVDLNSPSPSPPFTNWTTAAHVIQDAVDAALDGDEIVVTNGTYNTGGRAVYGLTNRVTVDRSLTVRSASGPLFTTIQGYQVPVTTNGDGAIRCVYLTNGATLSGFTLTNGATQQGWGSWWLVSGGGVYSDALSVVSNCVLQGNSAVVGGGASGALLRACTLTSNSSENLGGGAYNCTLQDCCLTSNSASAGGGAAECTLDRCVLSGNSAQGPWTWDAPSGGGGALGSSLNKCLLSANGSVQEGGGASYSYLTNCTLNNNSAAGEVVFMGLLYGGGGAARSTLYNCEISGNSADKNGGGAWWSTLYNCTLTGNSAHVGGGVYASQLTNCIVYYNKGRSYEANYDVSSFLEHCCTAPLPPSGIDNFTPSSGVNNLTAEPKLASTSHISEGSPCRGAGDPADSAGADIDGEPWAVPPSIGCDEFHLGGQVGPLNVTIQPSFTNVCTGYKIDFTARIIGNVSASEWDFGDGTVLTNRPFVSHAWQTAGDYGVALRGYNLTYPDGISVTTTVHVATQSVHYVSLASTNPIQPFSSWATAATTIQEAVDAATLPGSLILVSNGVYETGGQVVFGTMTNRVAVTKPLILRSLNGPDVTEIRGYQVPGTANGDGAIRCLYLTNGAGLVGFTLTGGATQTSGDPYREQSGGGVFCESASALVSNCVLRASSAGCSDYAGGGGGAFGGTLVNCTITSNSLTPFGGGCHSSTLYNCAIIGNSSGGAAYSTANDCVISSNSWGGAFGCALTQCTLSNNSGGGASGDYRNLGGTLLNCTLVGNSSAYGGGASTCTLENCRVIGNSAEEGGGARFCSLSNCTLAGNQANAGGGVYGCTVNNCIVYFNNGTNGANFYQGTNDLLNSYFYFCCTTPRPTNGFSNITNAPLFLDLGSGNLRLQSNSPCINAGNNAYAPYGPDLDGNPRIVGGTVDIGPFEFQNPTSLISYAWLQQYGLPTDGSADFADTDGDGMSNWQEWRCGTNPTDSLSALRMISALPTGNNVTVSWQSVAGINYFLERSTNLLGPAPLFTPVASGVPGQDGTTSYFDTNAVGIGPVFYRVGVGD